MTTRRPWALACAVLALTFACQSEVTLHLLEQRATTAGDAGAAGTTEMASGGDGAGAGASGEPGLVGEAGGSPGPCQSLGSEACNGGDDDCNGQSDEGCEYTVSWKRDANGATLGHATGGFDFFEPCPDGAVLIGLRVGMGKWLNQVSSICRQLQLHSGTPPEGPALYATLGDRYTPSLAPAGTTDTTNTVQDLVCPEGLILSGVDGTTAPEEAHYTRAIRITCAPLIVSEGSPPLIDTDHSQEEMVGPIVCGGCSSMPAYNFSVSIESGHVATSLFGAVGLWVDRVGFGSSRGSVLAK